MIAITTSSETIFTNSIYIFFIDTIVSISVIPIGIAVTITISINTATNIIMNRVVSAMGVLFRGATANTNQDTLLVETTELKSVAVNP